MSARAATIGVPRRDFLRALGLSLGGLALGVFEHDARADEPTGHTGPTGAPGAESDADRAKGLAPNALVHVAEDGTVTIVCTRSEMGQGVRSSIPVLIADELGASLARVVVRQADGDKKYGDQNTDGSSSIRKGYENLRRAGAAAREMLLAAAAKDWHVEPASLEAHDSTIVDPRSKKSASFGELAAKAGKLSVPDLAKVKLRAEKDLPHLHDPSLAVLDAHAIVTGAAIYAADVKLDGLLIAVVARPPVVGGKPKKIDTSKALAVPGVVRVVELPVPKEPWKFQPWGGVAVVAKNTWSAMRGRAALDVEWDDGENASYDSASFRDELLASVRAPGDVVRNVGDIEPAFAKAAKVVEAEYLVPHLAQLPMEPECAVARVEKPAGGGAATRCEVWTSTQNPQAARSEAAHLLGVDESAVAVHVTLLGGGFGRKSKADFVAEAVFVANEVGAPVRLQWSREDDVRHGYYNAVNGQRLRAALDERGQLVAWHHRTAFPPIANTMGGPVDGPSAGDLQQGVLDVALSAPNVRAEACHAKAHTRVGWYRSVYNIFHAFAVGSFIDEIAAARNADPRETWLDVIGPPRTLDNAALGVKDLKNYGEPLDKHPVDAGRLRTVIERVTDAASWKGRSNGGRFFGLAAHRSFVAYTACVLALVPDDRRKFRVDEAWIAIDAGTLVNRDRVTAQLEGAVVMGISNAFYGGIAMKGGAAVPSNFRDARVSRIGDAPRKTHAILIDSDAPPCGVGEPGVPPVGAALANALFAATGTRFREFPFAAALGV